MAQVDKFYSKLSRNSFKSSASWSPRHENNTLLLENFGNVSGLRLNDKKTEVLWIGSMVGKNEKLIPEKYFKWPENRVKVLGIWISTNPIVTLKLNYTEKLEKIRNLLSCWEYRRLTFLGKIQVIKSLALSQLTYILTPLVTNQNFISEITFSIVFFGTTKVTRLNEPF